MKSVYRHGSLGRSTGPLKVPASEGCVTDDHVALIHRSWRVADRDREFGGQKMYQIHVILFGEKAALDRVEYVLYRLDPSYPNPVHCGSPRQTGFELKELANGYSLIRANSQNQRTGGNHLLVPLHRSYG